MNTQSFHIVEGLLANRGQSAVEFPVTPVAVLHTDVLVSAGNIEKCLWTERTWCLFMSSKVNPECSHCTTVHTAFTTYKTLACAFVVVAGIEIVSDKLTCEAFVHDFEMLIEACISRTGISTFLLLHHIHDEIVAFRCLLGREDV